HSLFRQAVRSALETEHDLTVVAEAADGLEAVEAADMFAPDIALIDTELPKSNGIHATRTVRERVPGCKVLVLSNHQDQAALFDAMQAGASGYLTKAIPLAKLIEAARAILRGETIVPPAMLGDLLSQLVQSKEQQNEVLRRLSRLTRREREVLALLVEGADNDVVAQRLVISPETARTHIQNILSKLDVHSRLEALALVLRNNIVKDMILA
ncbi:MAG TPA: response regulator transcription factor, partial [Actinomycetota bacterium]|nr:response regulator transcription factor [Actinomycetota bacterium]